MRDSEERSFLFSSTNNYLKQKILVVINKMSIYIYDPFIFPTGPLSNHYRHFMRINNINWPTVTNFVYANMLRTPSFRYTLSGANINARKLKEHVIDDRLKQTLDRIQHRQFTDQEIQYYRNQIISEFSIKNMNIYDKFNHYLGQEYQDIVRTSLLEGYRALSKHSAVFRDALLATRNRELIYLSQDEHLGINGDNQGMNLVGITLAQVRHEMQIELNTNFDENADMYQSMYRSFVATIILKQLAREMKLSPAYNGMSVDAIIEANPSIANKYMKDSDINSFIEQYSKGRRDPELLLEHKNPGALSRSLYTDLRKEQQSIYENKVRYGVASIYIRYMIKKERGEEPSDDTDVVYQLFLSKPTVNGVKAYNDMIDAINQINYNQIDSQLAIEIAQYKMMMHDTFEQNDKAPIASNSSVDSLSADEICRTIKMSLSDKKSTDQPAQQPQQQPPSNDIIYIHPQSEWTALDPLIQYDRFVIEQFIFPSVILYVKTKLIAANGYGLVKGVLRRGRPTRDARKMILHDDEKHGEVFYNLEDIDNIYISDMNTTFTEMFSQLARIGLRRKFEQEYFQNILVATGNSKLVWNDRNDMVLGIGNKNGLNVVGGILMEMRQEFARKSGKNISTNSVNGFIVSDQFIQTWLKMRTADLINISHIGLQYIERVSGLTNKDNINERLQLIVYNIFYGCVNKAAVIDYRVRDLIFSYIISNPLFNYEFEENKELNEAMSNLNVVDDSQRYIIQNQIMSLKNAIKSKAAQYYELLAEYANVFGGYLIGLLVNAIDTMNLQTDKDLRKVVVEYTLLLTGKKQCAEITDDALVNCIISAMKNLLSRISVIKAKYDPDSQISTVDIDFAVDIILSVSQQMDYEDIGGRQENVEMIGQGPDADERDNAIEFGFGDEDDIPELVTYFDQLGADQPHILADYFIQSIHTIRNAKMNRKILINRINAFTSINA